METNTCAFKKGDLVKLEKDVETEYKIQEVYPSKLRLTNECKYDLIQIPKKSPLSKLKGILESQLRIS